MDSQFFIVTPIFLLLLGLLIWLLVLFAKLLILVFKALKKYLNSEPQRQAEQQIRKSLGEVLKDHRVRCAMTQEFVAESLGVSRQAVSKWENGTADPSTTNLLKLAKLFNISPEELLHAVTPKGQP